jgi:TPR repeat protein
VIGLIAGLVWYFAFRQKDEIDGLSRHEEAEASPTEERPHPIKDAKIIVEEAPPNEALCDKGDLNACIQFAVELAEAQGPERDEERAAKLFERACEGKLPAGCGNWAAMMAEGRGVEYDPPRAAGLLEQACNDGHAHSCYVLGGLLNEGLGIPKDAKRARQLFATACKLGVSDACDL